MKRLTKTYNDKTHGAADDLQCGENSWEYKGLLLESLGKYEDLGYTAEELKLCFNPPNILYVIGNESDGERVHPIYPVDGEQVEFANGNVYWNCRDDFDDCVELPLDGLNENYFLSYEEAHDYLN